MQAEREAQPAPPAWTTVIPAVPLAVHDVVFPARIPAAGHWPSGVGYVQRQPMDRPREGWTETRGDTEWVVLWRTSHPGADTNDEAIEAQGDLRLALHTDAGMLRALGILTLHPAGGRALYAVDRSWPPRLAFFLHRVARRETTDSERLVVADALRRLYAPEVDDVD